MSHSAIYALYPNVVYIDGDTPFDADNNEVVIDQLAVEAKDAEIVAEFNLKLLREERNTKLEETDWWVLSDTQSATQAQLDYRQALRDITDTYTSLEAVVWPVKPE